jgi:hypothetical protein
MPLSGKAYNFAVLHYNIEMGLEKEFPSCSNPDCMLYARG